MADQLNLDVIKLLKINEELSKFLKDLTLSEETNNNNANSFVGVARDEGIKNGSDMDDGIREAITIREYLIQFTQSGLELKLKVSEMLRDPILTKKIGLLDKSNLQKYSQDMDQAFNMGRKLIDGAKKYLGEDYLSVLDPNLYQGALQLMSKRMAQRNK